jgi:hypothetical protein
MIAFILGIWTPLSTVGILKIHDQVPSGLGYPGGSGVRSCTQNPDPPTRVLDDRQHVQAGAG